MAEATTFQTSSATREGKRAAIKEMIAEMDQLHQENVRSKERMALLDQKIDASLASIDATLARLSAA